MSASQLIVLCLNALAIGLSVAAAVKSRRARRLSAQVTAETKKNADRLEQLAELAAQRKGGQW